MARVHLDNSLRMLAQGYAWLPDKRRAQQRRTVVTRLIGRRAVGREGPAGTRFFYDESHVRRAGALPEPVSGTLFGKGGVHHLDEHAHRVRKAMFVALLMGDDVGPLVERATAAWDDAATAWSKRPEIVLSEESATVLTSAVSGWAGIPVADDEVPSVARDLTAMVDGFATGGARRPGGRGGPRPAGGVAGPAGRGRPGGPRDRAGGIRGGRRRPAPGRRRGAPRATDRRRRAHQRDPPDRGHQLVPGVLGARADPLAGAPGPAGERGPGVRPGVRGRGPPLLSVRAVRRRQGTARGGVGRRAHPGGRHGAAGHLRAEPRPAAVGGPLHVLARALPRRRHRRLRADPAGRWRPAHGAPLPRRADHRRRALRAGRPAGPAAVRRPRAGPVDLPPAHPGPPGERRRPPGARGGLIRGAGPGALRAGPVTRRAAGAA